MLFRSQVTAADISVPGDGGGSPALVYRFVTTSKVRSCHKAVPLLVPLIWLCLRVPLVSTQCYLVARVALAGTTFLQHNATGAHVDLHCGCPDAILV